MSLKVRVTFAPQTKLLILQAQSGTEQTPRAPMLLFDNERTRLESPVASPKPESPLLLAAQMTVIIDDVTLALLVIVKAGIVDRAASALASRLQIIATYVDVHA